MIAGCQFKLRSLLISQGRIDFSSSLKKQQQVTECGKGELLDEWWDVITVYTEPG